MCVCVHASEAINNYPCEITRYTILRLHLPSVCFESMAVVTSKKAEVRLC